MNFYSIEAAVSIVLTKEPTRRTDNFRLRFLLRAAAIIKITRIITRRAGVSCKISSERGSCCRNTGDHQSEKGTENESFELGHFEIEIFKI